MEHSWRRRHKLIRYVHTLIAGCWGGLAMWSMHAKKWLSRMVL